MPVLPRGHLIDSFVSLSCRFNSFKTAKVFITSTVMTFINNENVGTNWTIVRQTLFVMLFYINSPDNFLNGFTRLSGLAVPGSRYFFKVSSTPDFDNKILSTVESGFEAQNLLKFCPEYWFNYFCKNDLSCAFFPWITRLLHFGISRLR